MTLLRTAPSLPWPRVSLIWMQFLALLLFSAVIPVAWAGDPVYVDDRDPSIVYSGNWTQARNDGLSDGGDSWSETPGDTVSFTFIGSAIEYYGAQSPRNGRCSITIDGVDHGKIVAYAKSDTYPSIMLFRYTQDEAHALASPNTPSSNHTIVIGVITDQDQPNGARCEVDYFKYLRSSTDSFTTSQSSSSDQTDNVQSIVLPSILVPAILAFLAWGIWWWYKHQRSEMRRELMDLRQAIALLRNPHRHRNVSPPPPDLEAPLPAAPRRRVPSYGEAPVAEPGWVVVPEAEMGGINMTGIGARPVSLPARLGGVAGPSQPPRRSTSTPIRRPLGARPVPSRPSPLSASITRTSASGGGGSARRTPVMTPSRRRTDPPMATVTEDGVLGVEDNHNNLSRASMIRNDPNPPRPRRASVDDDDSDAE